MRYSFDLLAKLKPGADHKLRPKPHKTGRKSEWSVPAGSRVQVSYAPVAYTMLKLKTKNIKQEEVFSVLSVL